VPGESDIRGTARGAFAVPLSILELATISEGSSPSDAIAATTEIAKRAESGGYHRLWVAEHHGMPSVASSSPAVLLAHLGAVTDTIRLGSGGVMLPNHAPLAVAEQFATLEALHPGRIDLGIGRAPGTDGRTAMALRGPLAADAEDFPERLAEVAAFLDASFPAGHRYERVEAVPGRAVWPESGRPPIWLLGSSGYSARLAGLMGLPFAFARHFSRRNTLPALELYRSSFTPSDVLAEPYAMVCTGAVAADSDEEARALATAGALAMLRLRSGRPGPVPTPEEALAFDWSGDAGDHLERWLGNVAHGTPQRVVDDLEEVRRETGADELMLTASIHGEAPRIRSFELIAEVLGMPGAVPAATG
jgi:luciferase family oxidoreductase group 1